MLVRCCTCKTLFVPQEPDGVCMGCEQSSKFDIAADTTGFSIRVDKRELPFLGTGLGGVSALLFVASWRMPLIALGATAVAVGIIADVLRSQADRRMVMSVIPGYLVFGKPAHFIDRQFVPAASLAALSTELRPRIGRHEQQPPVWLATHRIVAQCQGWQVVIAGRVFESQAQELETKIRNLLEQDGHGPPPDMEVTQADASDQLSWRSRGITYRIEAGDDALRVWRGPESQTFEPDDLRELKQVGDRVIATWTRGRSSVLLSDPWPDRRNAIQSLLERRYQLRERTQHTSGR